MRQFLLVNLVHLSSLGKFLSLLVGPGQFLLQLSHLLTEGSLIG